MKVGTVRRVFIPVLPFLGPPVALFHLLLKTLTRALGGPIITCLPRVPLNCRFVAGPPEPGAVPTGNVPQAAGSRRNCHLPSRSLVLPSCL